MNKYLMVPVELIERTICRLTNGHEHDKAVRELRALLSDKPQATRCPDCGYLTSEREHLGCLRKAVSDLDAATGGQPQASAAQSAPAGESTRIKDFNAGWHVGRDSVFPLLKKAAYMELDTTERSIAIQDQLRALLAAAPAQPASAPAGEREAVEVVGVVCVSRFKNNPAMENVEFQQAADIPQGQHDVMTVAQHERILAAQQRTQAAGVPDGWREFLQELANDVPPAGVFVAMTSTMAISLKARRLLAAPAQPAAHHTEQALDMVAPAQPEVQRLREALDHIVGLSRALRVGGPDPMDLEGLSNALEEAVNTAHAALTASTGQEEKP